MYQHMSIVETVLRNKEMATSVSASLEKVSQSYDGPDAVETSFMPA